MFHQIILAIPHSKRAFDSTLWSDPSLVNQDADRWTDWFTDQMFASQTMEKVMPVIGRISRFDCDLERLLDDPLQDEGRGILYTRSHSGATRNLTPQQQKAFMEHWQDYRNQIQKVAQPNCLLIDCHSFPSSESNREICIGFNEDWSRPTTESLNLIEQHFVNEGFSVGINTPYSNSLTPDLGFHYSSIMIELNKAIYLNETDNTLLPSADSIKACLNRLYAKLLNRE